MDKEDKIVYEELDYGIKRINSWYKKKMKSLSILTVPFNSPLIFTSVILEVLRNKGRVLYIWSRDGEVRDLVENIKLVQKNITYGYIEDGIGNVDIMFVNYKKIYSIKNVYDLAILDDVSNYSTLDSYNLKGVYEYTLEISKRSILYAVEFAIPIGEKMQLTNIFKEMPFIEPRIITTRIDLNKDIPYILYDYLKWFRDEKKRVIIFVPDKDKLDIVYDYYTERLKMDGVKVIRFSRSNEKKHIDSGLKIKDKAIFIITDFMEVSLRKLKINEIIVLFADSDKFNHKNLVYLCGNATSLDTETPEVLFVSREVSSEMEIAKDMAREFNKRLWIRKSINS